MEIIDPFKTQATAPVATPVEIVDPFAGIVDPFKQEAEARPLMAFSDRARGVFERAGVYDTTQVKSFADSWKNTLQEGFDASIFSKNFKPENTLNKALEVMSLPVTTGATILNEVGALANEGVADVGAAVAGAYKLLTTGSVKESKDLFESVREDMTFIKPKTETMNLAFDVVGKLLGAGLSIPAIAGAEGRGMVQSVMGSGYTQDQYDSTADAINYIGTLGAIILPTVKLAKDAVKKDSGDLGFDKEIAEAKAEAEAMPQEQAAQPSQTPDLFPETQKTPFGTQTGEAPTGWSVDENGMPVNREGTADIQAMDANALTEQMAREPVVEEIVLDDTPLGNIDPDEFNNAFMNLLNEQEAKTNINASGESAASAESISRLKSQNEQGIEMYKVNPLTNTFTPLKTVDRVDQRAKEGEAIIQRDASGKITVLENNTKLNNEGLTNRTNARLGGVGKKGMGQGGAISFGGTKKPLNLRDNISNLSKEEWIKEFNKQYPDSANVAESVYNKTVAKAPSAPDSNLVNKFANLAFDNKLATAVDKGVGSSLTRLENANPVLMQRAVKFEKDMLGNTQRRVEAVTPFMAKLDSLPKDIKEAINSALTQNDFPLVEALISKAPNKTLGREWNNTKKILEEVGKELQEAGVIDAPRKDYFPRIVKDREGLLKTLGAQERTALETRLREAEMKRGFSDPLEDTKIINQYLRGTGNQGYRPGFSKGRVFDEIPKELEQFYENPIEALDNYLRRATLEIETAKFFGKDAVKGPNGKIDLENSIGYYLNNEMNAGRIKPKDAQIVHDILSARFGAGARGSNSVVQGLKDAANIGLLGDVMNAAIQVADIVPAVALNGLRPTLLSIAHQFSNKGRVTAKDLGLLNRVADEFVSQRPTTKAVDTVFKLNGLTKIDAIIKNVNLQASYLGRQADVKAGGNAFRQFQMDYAPRFGDRFPQLVNDLREGKRTELTDELAFSELARRQPITRFNYPEMYLRMPNGRAIYTLKSFMLQQADLMRTQAYNLIKKGRVAEGLTRMLKLGIGLSVANTAMEDIRNYILGKPVDLEESTKPGNLLAGFFKLFGYNDYFSNNLKRGAWGEAGRDLVTPPLPFISRAYDDLSKDLIATLDGDLATKPTKKSLKYIPIVGDYLYSQTMEGRQDNLRRRTDAIKEKYGL